MRYLIEERNISKVRFNVLKQLVGIEDGDTNTEAD